LKAGAGGARLFLLLMLAVVAGVGYTAFSGIAVYTQLDSGGRELVAAQAGLAGASRSGDSRQLAAAAAELRQAERDFDAARDRASHDPALRLVGHVDLAGRQIQATARLGAIGADISGAGESAASIALRVDALRRQYAGQAITPDSLPALLKQSETIAAQYSASARRIGDQLRAAHAERAAVNTEGLVQPLRDAYQQVDAALADAQAAFARYQDVRRLLADLLGVPVL
jgi:hypothetical protein